MSKYDQWHDCVCGWGWVVFIVGVIVGLPCILLGCSDTICPLEDRVMAVVQDSSYDGTTGRYWITVLHSTGICTVGSMQGQPEGVSIPIFIDRIQRGCHGESVDIIRCPVVGIIFISIAIITLLVMLGFGLDLFKICIKEEEQHMTWSGGCAGFD